MYMQKKVGDISHVIPGAARGIYSEEATEGANIIHLLKGNNLDTEGGITIEGIQAVVQSTAKNADRYALQEGDVVIMARGSAIRTSFVTKEVANKKIVASANFLIIRPNKAEIKGEVIAVYLNSVVGQQKIQALSKGSVIHHIPTSSLRELQIPVPIMQVQQDISDIFCANREAYQATLALAEQQKRTAYASMLNMMLEVA